MANAATVGALRVVLGLDSAEYEGGLSRAQAQMKRFGAQMQSMGQTMMVAGAGMTAAITAPMIAAGFHLLKGSQDAAAAAAQVKAALTSMGNASGKTFDQLSKTAEGLRNLTGVDDDEILTKVTANLLTFGNVAKDVFDRAQLSILNISARMKTDLMGSTMMVGKALNDPVAGLAALRRVGIQFTDQQVEQIKAMAKVNDLAGAQGIMLGELERQFGGAAEAAGNADVWKPLKTALMDLEGAFEPLIRDIVAPLIAKFAELARSLAALSPEGQKFVLVGAAIAAAAGPVLIAVGSIVTAFGSLAAALGTGGILAGAGTAIGAIVPFILPVAAAVAGVVAAFLLFRDDVEPVLQNLWKTAQATLGPALGGLFQAAKALVDQLVTGFQAFGETGVGKALGALAGIITNVFGTIVVRTLTAAVQVVSGGVQTLSNVLSVLGDLLTGDFAGAWEGAKRTVVGVFAAIGKAVEALVPGVLGWIGRMVNGVTEWLNGKLFGVLRSVIGRVKDVSDSFFRLYDAVVGHSYVPDMVTEVGQWMAKLQSVMVDPAEKATKGAAEKFEQMRDRVRGIMQGLLTDREKLDLAFKDEEQAFLSQRGAPGVDAALNEEMLRRLRQRYAADSAGIDGANLQMPTISPLKGVDEIPGVQRLNDIWAQTQQRIKDSRENFADAFSWGMRDAMDGDWKGLFKNVMADILDTTFRNAGKSLFNMLQRNIGDGAGGWDLGKIGSAAASIFSKFPGFSTGGSILPSGAGGMDSQLMTFFKSPREQVDIYDPAKAGRGGGGRGGGDTHNYFSGNLMTPEFWRMIDAKDAQMGSGTYSTARKAIPAEQGRRQQYSFGGR